MAGSLFKLDSESGFVQTPSQGRWRQVVLSDEQHQGNRDSDCGSRDSEQNHTQPQQIRVSRAQTGAGTQSAGGQAAPGHTRQLSWHNLKVTACNSSELDMYLKILVVIVDD